MAARTARRAVAHVRRNADDLHRLAAAAVAQGLADCLARIDKAELARRVGVDDHALRLVRLVERRIVQAACQRLQAIHAEEIGIDGVQAERGGGSAGAAQARVAHVGRGREHQQRLRVEAEIEQQALVANALALEARLEHAPIALFGIEGGELDARVAPLNARARKLVAPGRASDPLELYRALAAQPHGQPNGHHSLIHFETEGGAERGLVAASALTLPGTTQRLAALMPVESELEAEALNAWRREGQAAQAAANWLKCYSRIARITETT